MAKEVMVWVMVLWLDGSGKVITFVPARWGSHEACMAATVNVPTRLKRFCMQVPSGTGYTTNYPPPEPR